MLILTEPIGSIPRPAALISASADKQAGRLSVEQYNQIADAALRDTIRRFEETDSPIITDGEQTKSSFATYPLDGASGLAADGVVIPFEDGHTRQLPRLGHGTISLRNSRVDIPRGGQTTHDVAGQAGRDLRIGSEPALSRLRDSRLPA